MSDDNGAGPDLFRFANAMLERSLPAIRAWLTSRLGPGAKIGSVRLDQTTIVVENALIPVGARLWIDVDEARLDARPEDLMAGRALAQLRSLQGAVRATEGDRTTFSAPLDFVSSGASGAWVDGEVRLGGATWKLDRGVGDAMPMYGTAQLRVDSDGWKVSEATLTSGASQTSFSGSGSLREGGNRLTEATLDTHYARLEHGLAVLAAVRGRPLELPFPLPEGAIITGVAALATDLTWRVDATAETERSELALKLNAKLRIVENAELSGTIAPEELLPEWLDRAVDRAASGPLTFSATASGALDALDARVELGCETLASPWTHETHAAVATLDVDEGRRYKLALDAEGAGHLSGRLGIAPYGSIDGTAELRLEPAAWKLGPLRGEGAPVELDVRVGGTRREPELKLDLKSDQLSLRRGEHGIETKRLHAKAELNTKKGHTRLGAARVSARVGPGSAKLEHTLSREAGKDVERTKIELARVDVENALGGFGLFFDQDWVGTDGSSARFVVPESAQIWADLTLEDGGVSGRGHVETDSSRLSLVPLRFKGGSFEGTEALATVAFRDLIPLGVFAASPILPMGEGNADLRLSLSDGGASEEGSGTRVDVKAETRRIGWRTRGGAELPALERASLELTVGPGTLEVRKLSGTLLGGRLEAAGAWRREGDASVAQLERLSLIGANRGIRERLGLARSAEALRGLSLDLHLRGDLSGETGALEGHATLTSERSRLEATVETRGRAFETGSGVKGFVHPADLRPWTGPIELDGDATLVAAKLRGTFSSPSLDATLEGGLTEARIGEVRAPVADLRAELGLGIDGITVRRLSALVAGGRVALRGLSSRSFGGAMARLSVNEVQLGAIGQVSEELQGSLQLEASFWRRTGASPGARISVNVDDPRYEALRRTASLFSRYGLKQPRRTSARALTATLTLADGVLELSGVEAALDAMTLSAAGSRSELGIWQGDATVVVKQSFLETSHLFVKPASWFGDVRVPIRLHGPDGNVRIETDVIAALDTIFAKTRLGRGLRDVFKLEPAKLEPPRHHAPSALASSDTLIDRIANDAPEADAALGALLDRGLEPEEIAERVIRRK